MTIVRRKLPSTKGLGILKLMPHPIRQDCPSRLYSWRISS
jgi:hypothetical protein